MARKKFTTTMDKETIKKLKKLAVDHDTDAGRMIEKLVEEYLKQKEKDNSKTKE